MEIFAIITILVLAGIGFVLWTLKNESNEESAQVEKILPDQTLDLDFPNEPVFADDLSDQHKKPSLFSNLLAKIPFLKKEDSPEISEDELSLTLKEQLTSENGEDDDTTDTGTAAITIDDDSFKDEQPQAELPSEPEENISLSATEEATIEQEVNDSIELDNIKDQHERTEKLLNERTKELEKSQHDLQSEIKNRKEFNKVKDLLEKELSQSKENSRQAQNELNAAQTKNEGLQKEIDKFEDKVKRLEEQISQKEDEIEKLVTQIPKAPSATEKAQESSPPEEQQPEPPTEQPEPEPEPQPEQPPEPPAPQTEEEQPPSPNSDNSGDPLEQVMAQETNDFAKESPDAEQPDAENAEQNTIDLTQTEASSEELEDLLTNAVPEPESQAPPNDAPTEINLENTDTPPISSDEPLSLQPDILSEEEPKQEQEGEEEKDEQPQDDEDDKNA